MVSTHLPGMLQNRKICSLIFVQEADFVMDIPLSLPSLPPYLLSGKACEMSFRSFVWGFLVCWLTWG